MLEKRGAFVLSGLAHEHLATFTDIPEKHYNRLQVEVPALLLDHVNSLLDQKPDDQNRLVRTFGGEVSAILSAAYARIDNFEISNIALRALADIPEVRFVSAEITDRRMLLVAVTPQIHGTNHAGDVVHAGIRIINSETDEAGTTAQPIIWRPTINACEAAAACVDLPHIGQFARDDIASGLRSAITAAFDHQLFTSRLASMLATDSRAAA